MTWFDPFPRVGGCYAPAGSPDEPEQPIAHIDTIGSVLEAWMTYGPESVGGHLVTIRDLDDPAGLCHPIGHTWEASGSQLAVMAFMGALADGIMALEQGAAPTIAGWRAEDLPLAPLDVLAGWTT